MVFEFIPNEIQIYLITGAIAGFVGWLAHQSICLKIQRKRTWRLERGFILSLKLQADLVKSGHPKDAKLIEQAKKIEEFVNVVLQPDSDKEKESGFF